MKINCNRKLIFGLIGVLICSSVVEAANFVIKSGNQPINTNNYQYNQYNQTYPNYQNNQVIQYNQNLQNSDYSQRYQFDNSTNNVQNYSNTTVSPVYNQSVPYMNTTNGTNYPKAQVINKTNNSNSTNVNNLSNQNYNIYNTQNYGNINQTYTNNMIVEIVMDYSGSMANWIETAKSVMENILNSAPQGMQIGFRVFGQIVHPYDLDKQAQKVTANTYNTKQKGSKIVINADNNTGYNLMYSAACTETVQVVPVIPLDIKKMVKSMNSVRYGGVTPLTYALKQTVNVDFSKFPTGVMKKIILISDGGETCSGAPCSYIESLAKTRPDITIDIIAVDGAYTLSCAKGLSNVNYYNIKDKKDFKNVLGVTLQAAPQSTRMPDKGNGMNYQYQPDNNSGSKYEVIFD